MGSGNITRASSSWAWALSLVRGDGYASRTGGSGNGTDDCAGEISFLRKCRRAGTTRVCAVSTAARFKKGEPLLTHHGGDGTVDVVTFGAICGDRVGADGRSHVLREIGFTPKYAYKLLVAVVYHPENVSTG